MQFCKEEGYTHVFLRTLNIFEAARHLFSKYGFIATENKFIEKSESDILIEEHWDYVSSTHKIIKNKRILQRRK